MNTRDPFEPDDLIHDIRRATTKGRWDMPELKYAYWRGFFRGAALVVAVGIVVWLAHLWVRS